MDRMMGVREVGEILGYKDPDVTRRKMREMLHMEGPLRVSESALQAYINQRTYRPVGTLDDRPATTSDRLPRRRNGKLVAV